MNVVISHRLKTRPRALPSHAAVCTMARGVFRGRWRGRGEIQVVVVGDRAMRRLHRDTLGIDRSTDVLAFPYPPDARAGVDAPYGDVVICFDQAAVNARRYGEPLQRELLRLVAHGLLHLRGYRDERAQARKRMWAAQERVVRAVSGRRKS